MGNLLLGDGERRLPIGLVATSELMAPWKEPEVPDQFVSKPPALPTGHIRLCITPNGYMGRETLVYTDSSTEDCTIYAREVKDGGPPARTRVGGAETAYLWIVTHGGE